MNKPTYLQAMELIDIAAKENNLYHYNGGQAYIRLSFPSNTLMIIDHSSIANFSIEIYDGTDYFLTYEGMQQEVSKNIRENKGTMVDWYNKYLKEILDA